MLLLLYVTHLHPVCPCIKQAKQKYQESEQMRLNMEEEAKELEAKYNQKAAYAATWAREWSGEESDMGTDQQALPPCCLLRAGSSVVMLLG